MTLHSPRKLYSSISSENKIHFWSITVSCIVTIVTFFIGIVYQFFIVDENAFENQQLTHLKLIEELNPLFKVRDVTFNELSELKSGILPNINSPTQQKRNFLEQADTVFSAAKRFNDVVQENSSTYFLTKYVDADSLIEAISGVRTCLILYEFLKKDRQSNLSKLDFKNRLEKLVGEKVVMADSIYDVLHDNSESPFSALLGDYNAKKINDENIDFNIKSVCMSYLLDNLPNLIDYTDRAREDLLKFSWHKKSVWNQAIGYFGITLVVTGVLWFIVLNITFGKNKFFNDNKSLNETIRYKILCSEIVEDYNDRNDSDDYIDNVKSIYSYQKAEIKDLRHQLNSKTYHIVSSLQQQIDKLNEQIENLQKDNDVMDSGVTNIN